MRRCTSLFSMVLSFALVIVPPVAYADTIWSWSFDDTTIVVRPSDSFVLRATLFNSPLSTEPITEHDGGSFTGDLQKTYDFTPWPVDQFSGLDVGPGESLSFILGTLTPIGGSVPLGTYPFCCEAHLGFGSVSTSAFLPPLNTFEIDVVPEPPIWALSGGSLLALMWRRLRAGHRA